MKFVITMCFALIAVIWAIEDMHEAMRRRDNHRYVSAAIEAGCFVALVLAAIQEVML